MQVTFNINYDQKDRKFEQLSRKAPMITEDTL